MGSRKEMKLTKTAQEVLVGTILGDGFLQKTGSQNARLRFEHSCAQSAYLRWKMAKIGHLFQGKVSQIERKHPISQETYCTMRAQSDSSALLGKWRKLFYPGEKKKIPDDLKEYLGPLALAVWYMDDGYYYQRDRCSYIYLGMVSGAEAEIVQNAIRENFEIVTIILDKKKKGMVIYFSPQESKKLQVLISQYVIEEMRYKLPS